MKDSQHIHRLLGKFSLSIIVGIIMQKLHTVHILQHPLAHVRSYEPEPPEPI
ncbi:unnamed protein product [Prunus brigantina]